MASHSETRRRRRSDQPAKVPTLSIVLGYGPVALLPLAAIISAALPPQPGFNLLLGGQLWAAGVLIFMGGVRRGLSFDRAAAQLPRQLSAAIVYFLIGVIAMIVPIGPAFLLLMLGYALAGWSDRRAARAGDVPLHFAKLRPIQAAIAVVGLAALLGRLLML